MSVLVFPSYVQIDMFPDLPREDHSPGRKDQNENDQEKSNSELPPDYWLKISNKLMKKLDRELQAMPEEMKKATISEIMHLMAQLL